MKPLKPKLRMPPAPDVRAIQQAATRKKLGNLEKLQSWTEEPLRDPPTEAEIPAVAVQPLPAPRKTAPAPAKQPPAPVLRQWETVPEGTIHPFSMHLPETSYQKADFCWKRTGYKSAKAFYVAAIEAFCAEKLKELGEKP